MNDWRRIREECKVSFEFRANAFFLRKYCRNIFREYFSEGKSWRGRRLSGRGLIMPRPLSSFNDLNKTTYGRPFDTLQLLGHLAYHRHNKENPLSTCNALPPSPQGPSYLRAFKDPNTFCLGCTVYCRATNVKRNYRTTRDKFLPFLLLPLPLIFPSIDYFVDQSLIDQLGYDFKKIFTPFAIIKSKLE